MKINRILLLFSLVVALVGVGKVASQTPYTLVYVQNSISTFSVNSFSNTIPYEYYPYRIYTNATGMKFNLNQTLFIITTNNPPIISNPYANVFYTQNTILSGNIEANNVTINSGVTITTEGFSIIAANTFNNLGNINTGLITNSGGTGGGAGGSSTATAGYGGNTLANGGIPTSTSGGAGSTPTVPSLTNIFIQSIFNNSRKYLSGGGGGGGEGQSGSTYGQGGNGENFIFSYGGSGGAGGAASGGGTGGSGGGGSYGIYIQANILNAGIINSSAQSGGGGGSSGGAGGGGGAGIIILSYGSTYISGSYTYSGGGSPTGTGYQGGSGGGGGVYNTLYSTQPIPFGANSFKNQLQINVNNINYIPSPNQAYTHYDYNISEIPSSGPVNTILLNFSYVNMTDITTPFIFNGLLQDNSNFASCPTFTETPKNWRIASDTGLININQSNPCGNVWSNNNITFIPKIILNYNFTTFTANTTNNPYMTGSITQNALTFLLSNTLISSRRNLANFSIFSQNNYNGISAVNLSLFISGIFNGYLINSSVSNTTANSLGKYFLSMPKSTFVNPPIKINLNASVTKPLFYQQYDTYCPATITNIQSLVFPIGLVDTNGTKYQFYIYSNGGSTAAGYLLQVLEQKGTGSILVQSYKIPSSVPFPLPLEAVGQQYAFNVYSSNCNTTYFKGSFSQPSNPTYITLSSLINVYTYNETKAIGSCKLNGMVAGMDNISCFASDKTNLAYAYTLNIYKTTTVVGTQLRVFSANFSGSSFVANVLLPTNSIYTGTIIASVNDAKNTTFTIYSNQITISPISLSAPLFGFLAFLLVLTLILGAVNTGKAIMLMVAANLGLFVVSMLNLVNIPLYVSFIFIVLSSIAVWQDKS